MKQFYSTVILSAALLLGNAFAADAAGSFDPAKHLYRARNGKTLTERLRTERMAEINGLLNTLDDSNKGRVAEPLAAPAAGDYKPDFSFGPTVDFGDVDGPDGEMWFYTMERVQEPIHYDFFTDYKLISFELSIYDADHKFVGTVKDKIDYREGEWRTPMCSVLPFVSRNFFNDDEKCEVIMEFAVNTKNDGSGGVRYFSRAYQVGGTKDAEDYDEHIYEFDGLMADVLDATQPGQPEKVFMTLIQGIDPEMPGSDADMWEWRLGCKNRFTVFGKAGADGKLTEVLVHDICLQNLPGNQDTTPQVLTFTENGKPYMLVQEYGQPLYMPFYGPTDEILQRPNNTLEINIYDLDNASVFQHTSIPFAQSEEDKAVGVMNLYSVGDCTYRSDINFHDYTDSGKAAFIVTRSNVKISSGEATGLTYLIYGDDGTCRATIYENALSVMPLSDVKGAEPMCMFVTMGQSEYLFNFVGLHSFRQTATIHQYLEVGNSDPDPLLANVDRVAAGDSYRFAFEMRYPTEDEDIAYMRIAWFNADGSHSHIDEVNMGTSVRYAMCFINGAVLDPKTFLSDDAPEYAMLIKRGTGNGNTEEFLVGQACSDEYPYGRDVLHLVPGGGRALGTIIPYLGENPMLGICWTDAKGYTIDFYNLPLDGDHSGIGSVETGSADGVITLDGSTVVAQGYTIELYSLQGIRLASAADTLDASGYPAGVYIARAGDSSCKLIVR